MDFQLVMSVTGLNAVGKTCLQQLIIKRTPACSAAVLFHKYVIISYDDRGGTL